MPSQQRKKHIQKKICQLFIKDQSLVIQSQDHPYPSKDSLSELLLRDPMIAKRQDEKVKGMEKTETISSCIAVCVSASSL